MITASVWGVRAAKRTFILFAALATAVGGAAAADYLVKDQGAYSDALKKVEPGDRILLANGTWEDFQVLFEAKGTEDAPITLMAETPGQVFLTGQSNLRIAGEHLVVWGLTFKDGYSPTNEVISFRRNDNNLANHVRLVENTIQDFNKPTRQEQDSWVVLFGQNNRVDRNAFLGKTNKGPTLIVRLDTPESQENNHIIERNFFGGRPPLGGNGGETLRIGVSQTSRTNSRTLVRQNYFERCDGEVEIISIKSQYNVVAENVFYESRGSVVFRHGGHNDVVRNIFLGNGVSDTGGVRVINDNQTIRDNYLEGLRGEKFLGALVIMNGVPNSPENRYHQVENARVMNNSFVDVAHMGFGVGSDEERSAAPTTSQMAQNIVLSDADSPVGIFDDVSGISFQGNVTNNRGFEKIEASVVSDYSLERAENGLVYMSGAEVGDTVGAPRDLIMVDRALTGPRHFVKAPQTKAKGKVISIGATEAALTDAIATASAGDTISVEAGEITLSAPIVLTKALSIQGTEGTQLVSSDNGLFILDAGADLTLEKVQIKQMSSSNAVFHGRGERYMGDYRLSLLNVAATAEGTKDAAPLIAADGATFARDIKISGLAATNWSGTLIDLSGDGYDGWYLSDEIIIKDSAFSNIDDQLIKFGREGRDESTFGPRFALMNSALQGVGGDEHAIELNGIDGLKLDNNAFSKSGDVHVRRRVLGLVFRVGGNASDGDTEITMLGVDGTAIAATLDGGVQ